jgi:hypothetical protein
MTAESAQLQPLPIPVRPHAGERVESYLHRLARANHLRPSYLRRLVLNSPSAPYGGTVDMARLAILANRRPGVLGRALRPAISRGDTARSHEPTERRRLRKHADRPALFAAIRELADREQMSIRALADRFAVHRRTVRRALAAPIPPPRKTHTCHAPRLDPARTLIHDMLAADPAIPAGHVWQRLLDEHDVILSYSTVRKHLADHRQTPSTPASSG